MEPITVCDAWICEVPRFKDHRGHFQELFSQRRLPKFECRQINCSVSQRRVLRGLHIAPFGKLVHCVKGSIFDVVVDVRIGSATFGKWYGMELNETNHKSLFIPPECAHGFLGLCDENIVIYAQDGLYDPVSERSLRYNDPAIGITWPICEGLIISNKDMEAPFLDSLYA
jgi:dTDP-4-dehydrorhamnose 3,5-epimerase